MNLPLDINVDAISAFSLAAQQNAYPMFRNLSVVYRPLDTEEDVNQSYQDIVVRLTSEPVLFGNEEWVIDKIQPGQTIRLQQKPISASHDALFNLTEEIQVTLTLTASSSSDPDTPLAEQETSISVLPANFWGGESRQPDLLAAFVKPNGLYVESLIKQVAELLESEGHGRSVDGYQSNTREKPYLMIAALWNVIFSQRIAYVTPPLGFAEQGQRIRLPSEISASKLGACLDTSVLFASCLEAMGLNPVIAMTREHACIGVWLIDECFPVLTNDDPMDLRKRIDTRDLVLFESTLVTNSTPVTFEQAKERARELISEDNEADFVYLIDIKQARSRKIKPMSSIEERQSEIAAETNAALSLPLVPPLPPVRAEERLEEETPETRIDAWQRKLLDLTKRNSLLAFKDRAMSIRLYCPDIGSMEDNLADGVRFSFQAAEESPLNDGDRSSETFRLQAGSDIHRDYALNQLDKHVLLANMTKKKLESSAVNLLRKAKNDLEEGGSNTLYLTLGMLRWKENPEDDRSYRAPLILIPAQLERKSARAPIKVRQIPDESPIFNMTLIEFLYTEHSIDLNQFRDSLPEDESGVDVALVWNTVRAAIAEQPGFEVVEDLVLASFSFAKYLMWKDLKDRIEDLKDNPFVKHLVDHPQEAYVQDSNFVSIEEVDEKVDPEKVFTPLNCDSSQLVAVEASGRKQDFVLEGPPGTGKSETIANIICHNIAMGRKVLFVAEKMAALKVVYRRLEKVGLDHLCLELHSNKANKKAVLEQLRHATDTRENARSNGWLDSVRTLKAKRDGLNAFVGALHEKSAYGISPRASIARDVLYKNAHHFELPWVREFSGAPIQNEDELNTLLEVVKQASIAYNDIAELDPTKFSMVKARDWSNAWQSQVLDSLEQYKKSLEDLYVRAKAFLELFNISVDPNSIDNLERSLHLASLVDIAESHSLSYLLKGGVKDSLRNLEKLALVKREFDAVLKDIGHKITPEILAKSPVATWLSLYNEAKTSWIKRFLAKWKINRTARQLGYEKFKDLNVVSSLDRGSQMREEIVSLAEPFQEDKIWQGWETRPENLASASESGVLAHKYLTEALGLVDEPTEILTVVKTKLIDGRDFLDNSKLMIHKNDFMQAWRSFEDAAQQVSQLQLELNTQLPFHELISEIDDLCSRSTKLKAWTEWLAARESLNKYQLLSLADQIEARTILSDDAKDQVLTAVCRWLAPQLIDEKEELRHFKSSSHEQMIQDFRELDAEVAETTSEYIAALAAESVPDPFAKESPKEFGVLARELQKKTRHKPVRALFNEMGERLLDLCPCMMMSPLSVAQFLPSEFTGFDLVVFDEASQMTTWDSVGAIARGENVIIVGDPKQMPPTSFFSGASNSDDPDEEDLESILDQALAARLPHLRLKGHYRSRHETLIAFSNSKYYENSLITYPSSDTKESAVTLHRVNGVYAKGKGRNNPIEASAVVDEIVKRLMTPEQSKKSIGVVTLNTEQQRTIEDLLDDARRKHPSIEPFFHSTDDYDGVFVKNLESVQGDERDVIILSLGYGPTEPNAPTMSMNFGPLNKSGGERRLNVAITRATSEVLLFSSFESSMIDLSRTSALAVEHLKHYLDFAERGPIALSEQASANYGTDQFDSDFEQAVAWALRDKGWKAQTQIGVSKFRVDLGIVHPHRPGVYLAGVECDGATYHGSPSARDRDRVRQGILENLGWRLVRIWSTDYFQDPEGVLEKVDARLREILEEDRIRTEEDAFRQETTSNEEEKFPVKDDQKAYTADGDDEMPMYSEYPSTAYFQKDHEPILINMAKDILSVKNGITMHELVLDIANLHGLTRTSKKQLTLIESLIKPWAGIKSFSNNKPVVWLSPDDIVDEMSWRGLSPWGNDRDWSEIPYPEAIGLARFALSKLPSDPVDYVCDVFKLKRRHEKTLAQFKHWIDEVAEVKPFKT